MNNIDKRALREAADSVIQKYGSEWFETGRQLCTVHKSKIELIAAANPATVLALLDELEAKDNRINRLEAIVAVAEQRNALMREWKRALKVPCDLVDDQVPVVIHGMVIRLERLKETEEKLAAAAGKGE
ncbi:ead/Ea22-like family protein [Enterobacter hormaechei subsp. xiangfangensis]|nr:ead/Ea22-like family protein [Enterobacter hormaechei]HBM2442378.1 ead/Ea22-like family protein [Enterobacter hormaechei subsp. xiangfangensis]HDV9288459.1 ead/Ea22-like family protein [Enterobacter hormaechei subsp. steigerwaltii]ELD3410062.1 ead/Ea22-like family protein [Enterobacter hormaechei]MCO7377699.1 ead/Ea22-like family protein [Enterobacter hormaechei]MEC6073759.1 ead/Ea22-like family protein [Enterobacter hormaechei]